MPVTPVFLLDYLMKIPSACTPPFASYLLNVSRRGNPNTYPARSCLSTCTHIVTSSRDSNGGSIGMPAIGVLDLLQLLLDTGTQLRRV